MDFEKLSDNTELITQSANLIYNTDIGLFKFLFGKRKKAIPKIEQLIKTTYTSFSMNFIYIAKNENDLLGIVLGYKGNEIKKKSENKEFYDSVGFLLSLKITLKKFILNHIITLNPLENDFYISNICVNEKIRGKGIGSFLLQNIYPLAKSKGCNRIVLDVSAENTKAISFYEKTGFKKIRENKVWFLPLNLKTFTMTYQL